MWSALSKDFMSFAKNVKEESHGFMGALSRFAADVVGEGGIYAGDEASQEAVNMPLEVTTLLAFQEDPRTYTASFTDDERAAFRGWSASSPFSSVQAAARRARAARSGSSSGSGAQAATSPSPSSKFDGESAWADEPTDETRQRLLDYSEVVLEKYMEFVGDAVSPRLSVSRKANQAASPKTPSQTFSNAAATPNNSNKRDGAQTGVDMEGSSPAPATPPPARMPGSPAPGALLGEDDFFDRYFFRLAQLRCQVAEQRRTLIEAAEQQREHEEAMALQHRQTRSISREGADEDERERADDDVAVPLFAKKVLSAASGFMNAVDSALIGPTDGRDPNGSDDDNVAPEMIAMSADGHVRGRQATASTPGGRLALHQQVVGLESVVHELQEELRREAARRQQLEALLTAHNIPIPAPPTVTPQKPQAPLVASSTPAAVSTPAMTGVAARTPSVAASPAATSPSAAPVPASAATPAGSVSAQPTPFQSPAKHSDPTPAATPAALPPTPPSFKPFVPATPASQASTAATSASHTPAAAAAAPAPASPPVFAAMSTPMGSTTAHSGQPSPLSSKKNE